ncbi:MAG: hypothetical protein WC362_00355 [Methanoregula sp.]|jgi:hypothetical protein
MKCPNPQCNKDLNYTAKEADQLILCPYCSTRLSNSFNIVDFIDDNVNLFNIFGIFTAIAVILPTFSQYSSDIVNKTANPVFYLPPNTIRLSMLDFFTSLFVIGCGITILLIFTMIIANLFGGDRDRELIYWQSPKKRWKITRDDIARFMFAIPFTLLSLALIMYIALVSGDYFQYYMILQVIVIAIIMFLIYRGSPHLFMRIYKKN